MFNKRCNNVGETLSNPPVKNYIAPGCRSYLSFCRIFSGLSALANQLTLLKMVTSALITKLYEWHNIVKLLEYQGARILQQMSHVELSLGSRINLKLESSTINKLREEETHCIWPLRNHKSLRPLKS